MPDFTTEHFTCCVSSKGDVHKIKDYTVTYGYTPHGPYQYDWECTCKGFRFRRKCKHIEEAKKLHCGWDAFLHSGTPTKDGKCPRCGKDTTSTSYTV